MLHCQPLQPTLKYVTDNNLRKSFKESRLQILPEDTILLIFSHLKNLSDVKSVRRTSRFFYKTSEKRLVEILSKNLNIPIVPGTLLDQFRPLSKLHLMLEDFLQKYIAIYENSTWGFGVGEIHVECKDAKKCNEAYAKILWHLLVHKDMNQPYVQNFLQMIDHEFEITHHKIVVVAFLFLPNDIWTHAVVNYDEDPEIYKAAWKDPNGKIYFGYHVPKDLKRKDNHWVVSF